MDHVLLEERALLYCQSRFLSILKQPDGESSTLGGGTDGTVFLISESRSGLKIFRKAHVYETELECYLRLQEHAITEIYGFAVPELRGFSDELLAIEMTVVQPPRILDFGKVSLDDPGDFSETTMADWNEQQEELWGDTWPTIQRILRRLQSLGIYYRDPNPYNITPENWNPDL